MTFDISQVKEAYNKLKSYVYYDNTDIILRKKLVEFETNRTKDWTSIFFSQDAPYNADIFDSKLFSVDEKLELFTSGLNEYHSNPSFFDYFINQIDVDFYIKGINENNLEDNFITNKRVEKNYEIDRVTAFINAPVEIHLLSVLWIMQHGRELDGDLSDSCLGNRLLLTQNHEKIVQGSGLFKPYHAQYKKWRDDSIKAAQSILDNDKDVLFLNLDIRDYFHSVRIETTKLFEGRGKRKNPLLNSHYNLKEIFLKIHEKYTALVGQKYQVPYNFYVDLKENAKGAKTEVILPIGLVSSYVLANEYLKEFDSRIKQIIKPAYYGRYVDDILIVIADPQLDYHDLEQVKNLRFDFEEYKSEVNDNKDDLNEKVSFEKEDMTKLEKFVLPNFHPVIKLVDAPDHFNKATHIKNEDDCEEGKADKVFKLSGYSSLYCQSKKSLLYYFDHEESNLVIDKLKKELDERTSEFRDFPEEDENEETFEESAYHLLYDGTEGKIRTLKDYKENRYGLTVYLANKIFSALRHEKRISTSERDQVLKFFRGTNCLNFYRLWERIFTFFLVNNHAEAYVSFYLHCFGQLEKISVNLQNSQVKEKQIFATLFDYLDCAHEIAISLNPEFISKAKKAARHFEFQINKIEREYESSWFAATKPNSFWGKRFRETNMIRHHYVVHPLLNYTKESKLKNINLASLRIDLEHYALDMNLIEDSPRPIKFSECCMATVFVELADAGKKVDRIDNGYTFTKILGLTLNTSTIDDEGTENVESSSKDHFYLEDAFELYKRANKNHIPAYILEDKHFRNQFYVRNTDPVSYDNIMPTQIQELRVNSSDKLPEPKIAFANTEVKLDNIIRSVRNTPNLEFERYQKLAAILRQAREARTEILLFPEFFIPVNLLSSLVRHSQKNNLLTVTGLEHITIDKACFNFIVTILPVEVNGIKDSVVIFRLKNHYAHIEEELIEGNHYNVPKPSPYRYDIFVWRNIYFSSFYCFELANALHRSLMKGKIDLLIGIEWNKDTPYFSNIVEAGSRDLHVYVAQVNTSQYGDTRLTQPVESARKDILKLKGGLNDAILTAKINLTTLREFQRQKFSITHTKGDFKPLPPDFLVEDVLKRINNEKVL
ncbi:MAG: RNA-directed DNA polymerase [Flavipsychrobacter sp.]|nr:RNA-directed DNA polymerase [Flavipsychrobacter sp.]